MENVVHPDGEHRGEFVSSELSWNAAELSLAMMSHRGNGAMTSCRCSGAMMSHRSNGAMTSYCCSGAMSRTDVTFLGIAHYRSKTAFERDASHAEAPDAPLRQRGFARERAMPRFPRQQREQERSV
jgi:hypothetical protein